MIIEKFCTRCGKKFLATGREVICPACKESAKEEAKKAAILRAKRASWAGESVPVRISGRASAVIRQYGAANNLPFAASLDALLKASDFFKSMGKAWKDVTPYKSHRRDRNATSTTETEEKPQDVPSTPSKPIVQAASKTSVKTSVKTAKKAVKTSTTAKKVVKNEK